MVCNAHLLYVMHIYGMYNAYLWYVMHTYGT